MGKRPISVTLDFDNLTWLRGRAAALRVRSVSELLDQLVTAARQGAVPAQTRSVVGTVEIDEDDPQLERADALLAARFDASIGRPLSVGAPRERFAGRGARKKMRRA